MPDTEGQGLERAVKTGLVEANRAETVGQVAGLDDALVQQCGDLGGHSRGGGFGVRRQPLGKCRPQGRNTGQGLAQPVVQLPAQSLLFSIQDPDDLPLQPLLAGDVPSCGVDLLASGHRPRVPLQPTERTVLVAVAILEQDAI